jgi:hypothetical protein
MLNFINFIRKFSSVKLNNTPGPENLNLSGSPPSITGLGSSQAIALGGRDGRIRTADFLLPKQAR